MIKKLSLFFLLIFTLTSCDDIINSSSEENWEILDLKVKANDWELIGKPGALNSYYRYIFNNVDELTDYVCYDGAVMGYLFQGSGPDEVQTPLPFTTPVGEPGNGGDYLWTETFTYDYRPGSIAFYVYYSDFSTNILSPKTTDFRVVLRW